MHSRRLIVLGLLALARPLHAQDVSARAGGQAAPVPITAVINAFVRTLNEGDSTKIHRFLADNFLLEPGGPTLTQRLERMASMRQTLGMLTVLRIESFPDGTIEATLNTQHEGQAKMDVDIERAAPYRIRGIRVRIA